LHEKSEKHYACGGAEDEIARRKELVRDENETASSMTPRAKDGERLNCLDFNRDYGDKI
jgi:hypothetical protein